MDIEEIKLKIKNSKEEKDRVKVKSMITNYITKATLILGSNYQNDAESIVRDAKILKNDVENGVFNDIMTYERKYYDLNQRLQKLIGIKQEEYMRYVNVITISNITREEASRVFNIHSEVNEYMSVNLTRAMTALSRIGRLMINNSIETKKK